MRLDCARPVLHGWPPLRCGCRAVLIKTTNSTRVYAMSLR